LQDINATAINLVGGKNASLGEMIQNLSAKGIKVPGGFATTTQAYRDFLAQNNLDKKIYQLLRNIDTNNIKILNKNSAQIRKWIISTPINQKLREEIAEYYRKMPNQTVAVRSSATAEDLPTASFAGQQETFLNIKGTENLIHAIKLVFASLFTSRAIAYRQHHRFPHHKVALSAGIQAMVRSDKAASGVIFTLDTESGFDQIILVTASYGLGETIVQGQVSPDEFYVHKPTLAQGKNAIVRRQLGDKKIKMIYSSRKSGQKTTKIIAVAPKQKLQFCLNDEEILNLARQAHIIENHYRRPMDIEWAKDGVDQELYIVQARPETVKSQQVQTQTITRYHLQEKAPILTTGHSVGQGIGQGTARIITNLKSTHRLQKNEILVTDMTNPDWEPIMKHAAAIVTNRGGRTCHAAIVARELGIPAVVGCNDATRRIKENQKITTSCAEGETGFVYAGKLDYQTEKLDIKNLAELPVKLCLILGNPGKAFSYQFLPNDGVGLARLEFIISNTIGIHPNALLNFKKLKTKLQEKIRQKTTAYGDPVEFYIEKLKEGVATIAAAFYPKEVIFRFSDFKSNEYANLIGGELFEPNEENPMIGFRGASRYTSENFKTCFSLECQAFKRVRETMGLTNAHVMVPFVRTVAELQNVVNLMNQFGLKRSKNGLKIYMMCEIPANALLAEEFLAYVDGFSIGSNDLTQLTLGLDRDSSLVAPLFDERNQAIKILIEKAIIACNKANKYIGICGQAPSDHPDLATWLVSKGIQSISLNADTIIETWLKLGNKL
jgi:pyruvate, water dikinase